MKTDTNDPKTPGHQLREAALSGDLGKLAHLVRGGVSANERDAFNNTALLHAARRGKLDCVRFLIDNGADVNIANDSGYTPLICAVIIGEYEIVKMLLNANAEAWHTLKNEDDPAAPPQTALDLAEYRHHDKVVELLKGAEALQAA